MNIIEAIRIFLTSDHAETLVCSRCGKEYKSIGKKDSGICKECQMDLNGGPLDGMKVGDLHDETGS